MQQTVFAPAFWDNGLAVAFCMVRSEYVFKSNGSGSAFTTHHVSPKYSHLEAAFPGKAPFSEYVDDCLNLAPGVRATDLMTHLETKRQFFTLVCTIRDRFYITPGLRFRAGLRQTTNAPVQVAGLRIPRDVRNPEGDTVTL